MIIPWDVDVPQQRWPIVNWLLVISMIALTALQMSMAVVFQSQQAFEPVALNGWNLSGFIGHMWFHGGILHLVGNMIFLWVFGNAVCAKIGNLLYLMIFLLVGFAGAAAHLIFSGAPAIGASGAINGIVGMFLVLFPQNEITCYWFYFFFIFKRFSLSSIWMIMYWLVFDIIGAALGFGSVAYFAHLGGFFAGVAIATILVMTGIIKMQRYERSLVQIIKNLKSPPDDENIYEQLYGGEMNRLIREAKEYSKTEQKTQTSDNHEPANTKTTLKTSPVIKHLRNDGYIRLTCKCGKIVKAPEKYRSRIGKCPRCGNKIRIED